MVIISKKFYFKFTTSGNFIDFLYVNEISIIYGKPISIEKRSSYEIWKYGQGGNYQSPSLSFTFYKQENPFTENDFQLKRDYLYKPGWYRALDIWRAGRIYKAGA